MRETLFMLLLALPGVVCAQVVINEFMAVNYGASPNRQGLSPDWIELRNTTADDVALAGWRLTDAADKPAKWSFPAWTIPAHGFVLVVADGDSASVVMDELHANFKLDGGGEYLGLSRPDGTVASAYSPTYPEQTANRSYGIGEGGEPRYFDTPTPGRENAVGYDGVADPPVFSLPGVFFTNSQALMLAVTSPTAVIRYTINTGAEPDESSLRYTNALVVRSRAGDPNVYSTIRTVNTTYSWLPPWNPPAGEVFKATVVRARTYEPNKLPSRIVTRTYFVSTNMFSRYATLPVVSLVSDSKHLFHPATGLYVPGDTYNGSAGSGNYFQEWTKPAHIEMYETNGVQAFADDIGIKMAGASSPASPQKGMHVITDTSYGSRGPITYPIFHTDISRVNRQQEFKRFTLRAWASDRKTTLFGDALAHRSVAHTDQDIQGYRPAVVFIDGEYWGLHELRESGKNSWYLQDHYGVDREDPGYDILNGSGPYTGEPTTMNYVDEGDGTNWNALWDFVINHDLAVAQNFAVVQTGMDTANLAAYTAHCAYMCKGDWPNQNETKWRPRTETGRFRWIQYDIDHAFNSLGWRPAHYDMIAQIMVGVGGYGPFPIFVKLTANPEFKHAFINSVADLMNTAFLPAVLHAKLDAMAAELQPYMAEYQARWQLNADWAAQVAAMHTFINQRPSYMQSHMLARFNLAGVTNLTVHVSDVARGKVVVNTMRIGADTPGITNATGYPWTGRYFRDVPVTLYAVPEAGSRFSRWEGAVSGNANPVTLATGGDVAAVFEPAGPEDWPLRITELMFNPHSSTNGVSAESCEFVELHNTGRGSLDLSGYVFTDGIRFQFPAGSTLGGGAYLLLVANRAAFASRYATNGLAIAGEYDGSLDNGGAVVTLKASTWGPTLAAFTYGDGRGWPEAADGVGHSLVPLVVDDQTDMLDYSGHWRASAFVDGSPGAADPEPAREVVLNELVAHTDHDTSVPPLGYDSNDSLELFNPGTSAVSLAGWYLSDRADDLRQWAIPPTNMLAPGAWTVFDEISGFHSPITSGFGLNKAGETVFLSHLPGGGRDRVVDAVRFKGQENGVSLGRSLDGDPDWYALPPTPAAANPTPGAGVVISEFLYHPAPAETGAVDEGLAEFIEIHNAQSVTAALWTVDGPWRIDGGVAYTFPTGTQLRPGERVLVVGFDPASNSAARTAFLSSYGLTNGAVRLLGPYGGRLDNHGERLALEKPLAPDVPAEPLVWVIVDEIIYFDRAPWPAAADGTGRSLQRAEPLVSGRNPANWYAAWPPTPGRAAERVVLSAPEDESVVFTQMDEPLRASVEPRLVAGLLPSVAFFLDGAPVGTDTAAPYAATVRLPEAGRYQMRAELTDVAGVWTSRTAWVTALALSNAVVTAPDDTGATVAGALGGGASAVVRVHWGSTDGGTNIGAWTSSAIVGTISNAMFATKVGPLQAGRTYAVRFSAAVGGRVGWSPAATAFTTLAYAQWPYAATIRFAGAGEAETLRDFPALVRLSTNLSGFAYSQLGDTWTSLRFTDETGTEPLAYEVDVWAPNAESAVWVRVPALTNGTTVRAYWGRAGLTNPAPFAARGAVWPGDDEAVWHWQDGLREATWRGREAIDRGSSAAPGIVGAGRAFDGVDDELDPTLEPGWYGANQSALTISLWVKPAVMPAMHATVFGADATNAALYLAMHTNPRVLKWLVGIGDQQFEGPAYETGAWQLISLVLSNGTAYAQKNDEPLMALGADAPFAPTNSPVLGRRAGAGYPFAGNVDEVRFSRAVRSAAWLRAAYRTVAQHASFTAYGPVVAASNDLDGDGLPDAWEYMHFGNTARSGDADWDEDGMPDHAEFVAGTDPTNAASRFALTLTGAGDAVAIGFHAVCGEPGSEGWRRVYSLEAATGLMASAWWDIPGHTNLTGLAGEVVLTNAAPPGTIFYRGNVWLTPQTVPP